jgi:peptidyl-prolyl cis-trans isomerase SurA
MKKLILITFFLFFFDNAFALNSSSKKNLPVTNFIIAKVNNKAITNAELSDRYLFVIRIAKINIKSEQDKKLLLNQITTKMIDEELIRQDAARLKFEVTPDEMRDAIEIVALQQKKNPTQFRLFFMNNDLSFDNYVKQLESEILWSRIVTETLKSRVKVSDAEVKEFFEQQKLNTNIKKFLIAEVFIPVNGKNADSAMQLTNKLVVELRQGANFQNIVEQFSSSVTGDTNGVLGWVAQGDVDPKIYNAISKLEKGAYSDSVPLLDGFHIFKVLDVKSEHTVADRDLEAARNAIFGRKVQSVAKGYLMDLRKKAFVEVADPSAR